MFAQRSPTSEQSDSLEWTYRLRITIVAALGFTSSKLVMRSDSLEWTYRLRITIVAALGFTSSKLLMRSDSLEWTYRLRITIVAALGFTSSKLVMRSDSLEWTYTEYTVRTQRRDSHLYCRWRGRGYILRYRVVFSFLHVNFPTQIPMPMI
jgi:hypothetical protein